ncbi:hypothetical protein FRB99_001827, partial [Tulasnella sp. 403]
WKMPEFNVPETTEPTLIDESSFATLFPTYREKYLRDSWSTVTKALEPHVSTSPTRSGTPVDWNDQGVICVLDVVHGSMSVRTTRKTFDPSMILKARDLIKLLARGVSANQALKILEDGIACDIIKLGGMVSSHERFVKRRQRIVGPEGSTLKAIELLTGCYILIEGATVSVMGPYNSLPEVRRIVTDCMKNIHPIYRIKELMIRRELAKDPKLANESWDRFLPKFKKRHILTSERNAKRDADDKDADSDDGAVQPNTDSARPKEKKVYTPFPPPPQPRKIDIEMETGEYWMKDREKTDKARTEKMLKQIATRSQRKAEKESAFKPPEEAVEDIAEARVQKRKAEREALSFHRPLSSLRRSYSDPMASTDMWQAPVGNHFVSIGPALQAALDALDGNSHSGTATEYHSFRYNFRPESLDTTKPGRIDSIEAKNDGSVSFRLEHSSTQGEDRHAFAGIQSPPKDFECVLVYDEATGAFTLEKLDSCINLKYDRAASKNANGRTLSPVDDSPTSGATLSSSSPPTPPNPTYTSFENVQINGLDLEVDEHSVAVAKPPPPAAPARSRMSGKSLAVVNPPPAPAKGKKRSRDAAEPSGSKQSSRPAKRPTPPPVPAPAPVPLSLPQPKRLPTPPTGHRSPDTFTPISNGFKFESDDDEPSASAPPPPKTLSKGFTLEVDENPVPSHRPFSEGFVEVIPETNMDTMFDRFDDADGDGEGEEEDGEFDVGDAEGDGEDDEDDEDEFGQELVEAFNQPPSSGSKVPMSLNAFAGGMDDDDESDETSEEESD